VLYFSSNTQCVFFFLLLLLLLSSWGQTNILETKKSGGANDDAKDLFLRGKKWGTSRPSSSSHIMKKNNNLFEVVIFRELISTCSTVLAFSFLFFWLAIWIQIILAIL
jgi:hypothetical protein